MGAAARPHTTPGRRRHFHPILHFVSPLFALLILAPWNTYADDIDALRERTEQENAEAQFILGNASHNGYGVNKDYTETARWYRLAAEQGHAEAQFKLGWCHYYGRGVEKDAAQAKQWFLKAADNGSPAAEELLQKLE